MQVLIDTDQLCLTCPVDILTETTVDWSGQASCLRRGIFLALRQLPLFMELGIHLSSIDGEFTCAD